jgi:excinuclease UvrABC ATPase subunit
MCKKKTQEEAEIIINERCREKDYEIIEPFIYNNAKSKIPLRCKVDGHKWKPSYDSFINKKTNCPKCSGVYKPTQEEAENVINELCAKMNYILLEPFIYKNGKTKLHLTCTKDKYDWFPIYGNFIGGNANCSKCNNIYKPTQEEAEERVSINCNERNCLLLENFKYIGAMNTILHLKCNVCNYDKWKPTYNSFINKKNCGCPKCGGTLKPTQ